jgi:hypothetical protein
LNANNQPLFRIIPGDDQNNPVLAKSASQAWSKILERINEKKNAKDKGKRTSVSGPGTMMTDRRLHLYLPHLAFCYHYFIYLFIHFFIYLLYYYFLFFFLLSSFFHLFIFL